MRTGLSMLSLALMAGVATAGEAPLQTGVVYFLPKTPEASLQQLEQIKADGFNMIKIASWVWTVPHGATPLRAVVDATLDWCDANGMAVWLLHNIQYGSPGEGGDVEAALRQPSAAARKSLEPWAHALAGHTCVVGVLLGNEVSPGGAERFDGHPAYLTAFRDWLGRRHGDIKTLNTRWGTRYRSFADVQVPGDVGRGAIDVRRFTREQFARFYSAIAADVLRPILGDVLYGSKGGASPYILRQMPTYSVASWDDLLANWPLWKTKLLVDTSGLPVFNSEVHLYHDTYAFGPSIELTRYRYFTSALLGEWMTASFAWEQWDKPEIAKIHAQTPRALADLRRVEAALRQFGRQEPAFEVLVTEGSEGGVEGHPPLELAYAYGATTGLPWRFIVDLDLDKLRAPALVVACDWLTQSTARALAKLPSSKQLVFVGRVPSRDEYHVPLPQKLRRRLRDRSRLIRHWRNIREVLHCPPLPAEFRQVVDVPYLWWSPTRGHYQLKVSYPRLEARQAPLDDGVCVAVVNHTPEPVASSLPFVAPGQRVRDLLNGQLVDASSAELSPLQVRLFAIGRAMLAAEALRP